MPPLIPRRVVTITCAAASVAKLDLSAIEVVIHAKDPRGERPYPPQLMVALLLYSYCTGTFSSRKIERNTYEDLPTRVIAGEEHPDHSTIAGFRKAHLEALASLFVQVVQLAASVGLVKLGRVAIDGTRVQANASKHEAMSYDRMMKKREQLRAEIAALLAKAKAVDEGANVAPDTHHLRGVLQRVRDTTGELPEQAIADGGYWAEENAVFCEDHGVDVYISMGREGEATRQEVASGADPPQPNLAMRQKRSTAEAREIYRARKWMVEAPIGQLEEAMGFRRFLLRGLEAVRGEWALVCTAHNLLELWRHAAATA